MTPQAAWDAAVRRVSRFTRVRPSAFAFAGDGLDCVSHARMMAVHLAVTDLEVSQHRLAAAAGMSQPGVGYAVREIAERRDEDAALDAALDLMGRELRRELGVGLAGEAGACNDNLRAAAGA